MALERRRGFKPDHVSFGKFMISEQARRPAVQAAGHAADIAAGIQQAESGGSGRLARNYKVNPRPPHWIAKNGNPRAIAHAFNDLRHAAANEFGRGRRGGTHALRRAGEIVGQLRGDVSG